MNPLVLTRDQVRQFDRIAIEEFGINSLVLMENAARGATEVLCCAAGDSNQSALVLCGPGNNGGDGLVIARHLHIRGWRVETWLFGRPGQLSADATTNLEILSKTGVKIVESCGERANILDRDSNKFEWIIDALLGTGSRPPLRSPYPDVIESANQAKVRRFAVDLPTGLDCDHATDSVCQNESVFSADFTATFVAQKPVMLTATGKRACGQITIVDIGAPPEVFELIDFPDRKQDK